tara:strand:+ start:204 stop:335 length:132 start_codon:yes stop_codon:yes gene_type:complete
MVGIITFTLVYIGPGDPAAIIAGDEATPEILERNLSALSVGAD